MEIYDAPELSRYRTALGVNKEYHLPVKLTHTHHTHARAPSRAHTHTHTHARTHMRTCKDNRTDENTSENQGKIRNFVERGEFSKPV